MEEMKNLVIQSLETRGVLGPIRAKIRSSVFKIVDEQDQKSRMGCGLKWENTLLYKVSETKCGLLVAELIREFLECLKMDYSLSVFIPECSISPERLKKEDIFYKMGLKLNLLNFFGDIPILNYITYYFLHSLANNPDSVYSCFSKITSANIEKATDDLIENNLKALFNLRENMNIEENLNSEGYNENLSTQNNMKKNLEDINKDLSAISNQNNEYLKQSEKLKKDSMEKLNDADLLMDNSRNKKSNDYEDLKNKSDHNNLSEKNNNKANQNKNIGNKAYQDNNNPAQKNNNILFDISDSSIIDEEIVLEDSYERSNDKKTSSNNNYNISQSGGIDGTVDSKSLEKYNYIESVQPINK